MTNHSYRHLLRRIMLEGKPERSRLGPTLELLGSSFTFRPGNMVWRRGFSEKLGWVELLQLLAGVFDPEALAKVSPKAASTGYFTQQMAYGPRIQPHLETVGNILRGDHASRRAVIQVAENDNDEPTCTLSMHFMVRQGRLVTYVTMRSWDAWLGLPYDIMMFGGVASVMAQYVGVMPGPVEVYAHSLHLYEPHWSSDLIETADNFGVFTLDTPKVSAPAYFWPTLAADCHAELAKCPWPDTTPAKISMTRVFNDGLVISDVSHVPHKEPSQR